MKTFLSKSIAWLVVLAVLTGLSPVYAQTDTENDLYDLSLEDLLNLEIFSASKKEENLFESPLSSSVITKQEIDRSGVTSIAEAMRLAPGVIVREYTNGSYDVHLRGLDNTPPNSNIDNAQNLITLVMIDGRIVFNYLNGGIFWNSLPVDLNDIDRIEIIRGPAAAMYGPNAMAGVINIITNNPNAKGFMTKANVSAGNFGTTIANFNVGNKTEKTFMGISGNFQKRDRYSDLYYIYADGNYSPLPDSTTSFLFGPINNVAERYPNPSQSMNKYGVNGFFNYDHSEDVSFAASLGYQDSESQIIFVDNGFTPLTSNLINSFYVDAKANVKGLSLQVNNVKGEQSQSASDAIPYNNFAAVLEYDWQLKDLLIRPGVGYNKSTYEWDLVNTNNISFASLSLRMDYNKENWRFIGAIRGDSYSKPDDLYYSWQLASIYKLNERNNLRAVYSRANAAPFIASIFLNVDQPIPPAGIGFQALGNQELKLKRMDLLELGYRSKLSDQFYLDLEVFHSKTFDYNDSYFLRNEVINGLNYTVDQYQNLDLVAKQTGASLSLNFVPLDNIQMKVFGTYQDTQLENFAPDLTDATNTHNRAHEATPSFYGGFYFDYTPMPKLHVNLNGYYMGAGTFDKSDGFIPFPVPTTVVLDQKVDGHFTLNAKVSYQVLDQLNVYLNARNLSNNEKQYAFSESVKPLILGGFTFSL